MIPTIGPIVRPKKATRTTTIVRTGSGGGTSCGLWMTASKTGRYASMTSESLLPTTYMIRPYLGFTKTAQICWT